MNCLFCRDRVERNGLRATFAITTSIGREVLARVTVCAHCAHEKALPLSEVLALARKQAERVGNDDLTTTI